MNDKEEEKIIFMEKYHSEFESELWKEFADNGNGICGLCANKGVINKITQSTQGKWATLIDRPCLCPAGRVVKEAMANPEKKKKELSFVEELKNL